MYSAAMLRRAAFLFLAVVMTSPGHAQQPAPVAPLVVPASPATNASPATAPDTTSPGPSPEDPAAPVLHQAFLLVQQNQLDAALDKVNLAIQTSPESPGAYGLRATIEVEKKLWDQAQSDFETALRFDGKNMQLKFDVSEIQFMQKKYDAARPGFLALESDPNLGDLSAYKVFLCDLFGGHEDVAGRELDVFNQAGWNASYYFANAAWALYHKKTDDARPWLASAANIYYPAKIRLYATSLVDLGYLPLPPAAPPHP